MKVLLRPKQVAAYLGISLPTLWRLTKQGHFVSKVQISSRAVGFFEEDVAAWAEKRKAA